MQLGIAIWIILVIVLLGGFEALAFIVASMLVAFIIGIIMASNKQETAKNGK